MSRRIYVVYEPIENGAARLVRAGTPAQAVRHVVSSRFEVKVASQEDIVALAENGVEDAGETPAQTDLVDKQ